MSRPPVSATYLTYSTGMVTREPPSGFATVAEPMGMDVPFAPGSNISTFRLVTSIRFVQLWPSFTRQPTLACSAWWPTPLTVSVAS